MRWRAANGLPVFAYLAAQPPVIDGALDEWTGTGYAIDSAVFKPENWGGSADLSGTCYVAWDRDFFYLGLDVRDDRHIQQSSGKELYQGDDVEIQMDVDLLGDFKSKTLTVDDYQVGIAALNLPTGAYDAYRWEPESMAAPLDVTAAVQPTAGGYILEVAWPWSALRLGPRVETPYGFCLSLGDVDTLGLRAQETMVSSCPKRKWGDPTTWGTLILVDW